MLEGVGFSKPIKSHVILQLKLKHKKGFHMTGKCKRALKWNAGGLVVLIMCLWLLLHLVQHKKKSTNLLLSLYMPSNLPLLHSTSQSLKTEALCLCECKDKSAVVIGGGLQWPAQVARIDCIRRMTNTKRQRRRKKAKGSYPATCQRFSIRRIKEKTLKSMWDTEWYEGGDRGGITRCSQMKPR